MLGHISSLSACGEQRKMYFIPEPQGARYIQAGTTWYTMRRRVALLRDLNGIFIWRSSKLMLVICVRHELIIDADSNIQLMVAFKAWVYTS
jgi:hypothetical protein